MKKVIFTTLLFVFSLNLFSQVNCPDSIYATATPELTYLGCDGSITISSVGGTPPFTFVAILVTNPAVFYTYTGSASETSHTFLNMCPATYEALVINSNGDTCFLASGGCSVCGGGGGGGTLVTVYPATPYLSVDCGHVAFCVGDDVWNVASATGDAPPFQYSFDGGSTWSSSGNSPFPYVGCYSPFQGVMAKDATGQIVSAQCFPQPPSVCYFPADPYVNAQNTCQGSCNGQIIVGLQNPGAISPGPYSVYVDGNYVGNISNPNSTLTLSNYCAGNYTITVYDNAYGCESGNPYSITIFENPLPNTSATTNDATCDASCDGNIVLSTSGGTPPYQYSLDCGSTYQPSNTFTGICPNTYCWEVKDVNNCMDTGSETINSNSITFSATDSRSECTPFTWIDGNTYTSNNNTAMHTVPSSVGCDSVITLDLTILSPSSVTDTRNECSPFVWIDGNSYTSNNNTATHTLTNASGCDSVVTLNLTINNSNASTDVVTACDSYTWIDGNTYTSNNNIATHTLTNASGCDSVVTLNLTINNSNASTDVVTACDSYTWIDGNTYTSNNNTATFTLLNSSECDSVVTLNLTINSVNATTSQNGITISANTAGAVYQWLDCNNSMGLITGETNQSFTPQTNGNYAVQVTANGCTDTSACVAITTVGILENSLEQDFVLFPNPSKGIFTIEFTELQKYLDIKIRSLTGQIIETRKMENSKTISFELNQPDGVYLLEISNKIGGKIVMKVVKE